MLGVLDIDPPAGRGPIVDISDPGERNSAFSSVRENPNVLFKPKGVSCRYFDLIY